MGAGHLLGTAYEKVDPLVGGEKYEEEKQLGWGMSCGGNRAAPVSKVARESLGEKVTCD